MGDFKKTLKQIEATKLIANYPEVLLSGGSRCFVPTQKVITKYGSKRIESITDKDEVLSYNMENQKYEYKKVLTAHRFVNTKKQMIKIRLKNGKTIEGTEDHQIWFQGGWHTLKYVVDCFTRGSNIWSHVSG